MNTSRICLLLLLPFFVHGQSTPRSFVWGSHTIRLLFEDTGLAVSAQNSITEDIKAVYSLNSPDSFTRRLYQPGDPLFGQYAGIFHLDDEWMAPKGLNCWDFKVIGGADYFCVPSAVSSNYLAKLDLVSQHHDAVAAVSNFIHTLSIASTSTISKIQFADMHWSVMRDSQALLSDGLDDNEYLSGLQDLMAYTPLPPSLLDFKQEHVNGTTWFTFGLRLRSKTSQAVIQRPCVYRAGKWRLVSPM